MVTECCCAAEGFHCLSSAAIIQELEAWLEDVAPHLGVRECVEAAWASLGAHCRVESVSCPRCGNLHLDGGESATRRHLVHKCSFCNRKFRYTPRVQGNPLAALGLVWANGCVRIRSLPGELVASAVDTGEGDAAVGADTVDVPTEVPVVRIKRKRGRPPARQP